MAPVSTVAGIRKLIQLLSERVTIFEVVDQVLEWNARHLATAQLLRRPSLRATNVPGVP